MRNRLILAAAVFVALALVATSSALAKSSDARPSSACASICTKDIRTLCKGGDTWSGPSSCTCDASCGSCAADVGDMRAAGWGSCSDSDTGNAGGTCTPLCTMDLVTLCRAGVTWQGPSSCTCEADDAGDRRADGWGACPVTSPATTTSSSGSTSVATTSAPVSRPPSSSSSSGYPPNYYPGTENSVKPPWADEDVFATCGVEPMYPALGSVVSLFADAGGGYGPLSFIWQERSWKSLTDAPTTTMVVRRAGSGKVKLTVRDEYGGRYVTTCPYEVPKPPKVRGSLSVKCEVEDPTVKVGEAVRLRAAVKNAAGLVSYAWNGAATGTTAISEVTFGRAGSYSASVKVSDEAGRVRDASCKRIRVSGR